MVQECLMGCPLLSRASAGMGLIRARVPGACVGHIVPEASASAGACWPVGAEERAPAIQLCLIGPPYLNLSALNRVGRPVHLAGAPLHRTVTGRVVSPTPPGSWEGRVSLRPWLWSLSAGWTVKLGRCY